MASSHFDFTNLCFRSIIQIKREPSFTANNTQTVYNKQSITERPSDELVIKEEDGTASFNNN